MLFMSLRLFDDYGLIRSFKLDIIKLLRCIGEWAYMYFDLSFLDIPRTIMAGVSARSADSVCHSPDEN